MLPSRAQALTTVRTTLDRIGPRAILVVGALAVIVYGYPGYMNYDAADQLLQSRSGNITDWHPPMMARYWHVFEKFFHGPLPLLVMQTSLLAWGGYQLFKARMQPRNAALVTVALMWFPPVLAVMGPVWKDAQMTGFLVAGFALLLRESRWSRGLGLVLLFVAAGVRDNAATALPPLFLLVVWRWGYQRKLVACALAFAMFIGIAFGAAVMNKLLARRSGFAWFEANAIHDISGMICFGDKMTDDEVRAALAGIPLRGETELQNRFCSLYMPRWWLQLSLGSSGLFHSGALKPERMARRAAYFRLIKKDPAAFLTHRFAVMRELLGLGSEVPDEPVCQTFSGTDGQIRALRISDKLSSFQVHVGNALKRCSKTLLFRPWAYALLGLILFGYALRRKDGLVLAVLGSGFLYQLSFLAGAAGAPFRYSIWLVVCVCVATVLVVRDRIRAGSSATS